MDKDRTVKRQHRRRKKKKEKKLSQAELTNAALRAFFIFFFLPSQKKNSATHTVTLYLLYMKENIEIYTGQQQQHSTKREQERSCANAKREKARKQNVKKKNIAE